MSNAKTIPDDIMDFIYGLTPGEVGSETIGNWKVMFEGFSSICLHDVERRMALPEDDPNHASSLEDVLAEVEEEFREALGDSCVDTMVIEASDPIVVGVGYIEPEQTLLPDL